MEEPYADWFLRDWMAHFGKRQVSLVNELGWDKARANFIYHGKQHYRRADVAQLSAWLGIEPYELLMPPQRALALRNIRDSAKQIVAEEQPPPFLDDLPKKTGTHG